MCKVSIDQFYGIEINGFAVMIAKTVLWIAEKQWNMDRKMSTCATIVEGNALRLDWKDVVPKTELSYIMGNPPFAGYKYQNKEQKQDLINLHATNSKKIDYVAGWYFKAAEFMIDTKVRTAFVSTNSIVQGEQVAVIWKPLFERGIHIDFAYRAFRWNSESSLKAIVKCVIIGFSIAPNSKDKVIYKPDRAEIVKNINNYLIDADNIFIEKRNNPISRCAKMVYGNEPREGGFLLLNELEKDELIQETPISVSFIKRFISSDDYINNKIRYCLWLDRRGIPQIRKSKIIMRRLKECSVFRKNSKRAQTHAAAKTPYLFESVRQPKTDYLLVPIVSSEIRKYTPIGYVSEEIIASNACFIIPNATLYHFGILTSNVHMAWVQTIVGRLGMSYRYSNTIVYNNFPWPSPNDEQREKIEQTAQAILDARALYPDRSLADLYKETTMPSELRKAHQSNDRAVMEAYGFDVETITESDCVAELMKMYKKLAEK